jgi:UDPglucose 6-dehydrogenase
MAHRLLDDGIEVLCVDSFLTGTPDNLAHLEGRDGFRLVRADVTDFLHVPGPVDYVLHLASPASPIDYLQLPIQTLKVGSIGTLHTLGLAKEKGARFLLASTSETYGDPQVHPQPESYWGHVNPVGPRGVYDEAKRFAEATTMAYRSHHGVNTAIMRIFNTFGPRMRPNDGRAIPNFIRQALTNAPLTVAGDGSQTRSVCYVDDLIEGAVRLLLSDLAGPVNIGNPNEMSVLEIAELVKQLTGSSSAIEFIDRPQDDPSVRQPDITMARRELGWEPRVSVVDGLNRTIDWFQTRPEVTDAPEYITVSAPVAAPVARKKVAVIGTGYVGAVSATCMAWLGHDVIGLDRDPYRAGQLSLGQVPFYEPGLSELLTSTVATGRLKFTDDEAVALTGADVIFLCVGTPQSEAGTPDLSQIESAVKSVASYVREGTVIVNKSTVPVGSGNWVRTLLEECLPRENRPNFHVVSNPEFLREGCALDDFLFPDRIVLGGEADGVKRVAQLYQPVLDQSFAGGMSNKLPQLITADITSAEMIKYAANAFLATKISFANEIANLCERVGADVRQVLPAIGADHRIGAAFLSAGVGWGGSCFAKDVAALVATGEDYGYPPAILKAAVEVNKQQRANVVRTLQRELRVLKGRRVALLGLAFKPETDDLRDAPALDIARKLIAAGSVVSAYDPVVKELPADLAAVRMATDVYDAAAGVDAVVLVTDWAEFASIDANSLKAALKGDLILDGRNCLPAADYLDLGCKFIGVGW